MVLGARIDHNENYKEGGQQLLNNHNVDVTANNEKNQAEEFKLIYPDTVEKKRVHNQQELSASSAKYLNQSLTFTPSQYQTQDDQTNHMNCSIYEQEQKSFPHMTLHYDQLTPIKNRDANVLPTLEDEGD